jgi:hypothetical protein
MTAGAKTPHFALRHKIMLRRRNCGINSVWRRNFGQAVSGAIANGGGLRETGDKLSA